MPCLFFHPIIIPRPPRLLYFLLDHLFCFNILRERMPVAPVLPPVEGSSPTAWQAGGDVVYGSRLSSSTCDSVRIYRSVAEAPQERDGNQAIGVALDSDRAGSVTDAAPDAPLLGPSCTIRYISSDCEDFEKNKTGDPKVLWASPGVKLLPSAGSRPRRPFHKWVQTLNRRHIERWRPHRPDADGQAHSTLANRETGSSSYRRHSSSISSFAYVSAMRDASISGASTSIVASSRRQKARSSKRLSKTDRSSRASCSVRYSEDGLPHDGPQSQADPAILERSKQRRRIIEELIETEEGYIGDIKFLMNVSEPLRYGWRQRQRLCAIFIRSRV